MLLLAGFSADGVSHITCGWTMKKTFNTSQAEVAQPIPCSDSSRCPDFLSLHLWASVAGISDTGLQDRVLFHGCFVDSPN